MLRNLFNGVILNLSFGILQAFGSETQARRDGELAESISGSYEMLIPPMAGQHDVMV